MTAEWTDWEAVESQHLLEGVFDGTPEDERDKFRSADHPYHISLEALEYVEASPYVAWQRHRYGADDRSKLKLPGGVTFLPKGNWIPDVSGFPEMNDDDVIVGVIDSGIPLGHSRLRDVNGNSRVLAAWQMNASSSEQERVPLGQELTNNRINKLLLEHSNGNMDNRLDEEAFNVEAGLVDFYRRFGHRELAARTSHGAAVLDIAAGYDAHADDAGKRLNKTFAQKTKIIAVNLPNHAAIGFSGEFLDMYILLGVKRILDIARAMWVRTHGENKVGGYPVVINISYGRQAGEKRRGQDRFLRAFTKIVELYRNTPEEKAAHCDVVMPVGNDNLERVHSEFVVAAKQKREIALRIQPADQSSSYVEVWTYSKSKEQLAQIDFAVEPPGVERRRDFKIHEPNPDDSEEKFQRSLGDFARIYTITKPELDKSSKLDDRYVAGFLICIAPTDSPDGRTDLAPAGAWRIVIQNNSDSDFEAMLMVQTEQSTLVSSEINRRAYFDDDDYQRHDETTGALLDNFRLDKVTDDLTSIDLDQGLVRRGSINSTAASNVTASIAGFRLSDGMPAPYSSSGIARKVADGRGAPSIALPTDHGPAHLGVITSGASDGSVAIVQGTSFASALAARLIAEVRLSKCPALSDLTGKLILQRFKPQQPVNYTAVPHTQDDKNIREKIGNRRPTELPRGRIHRLS